VVGRGTGVTAPSRTMTLNMGPQHPSTHGVLRLVLDLDGEIVVRCVPHIGYLHTGIEKGLESKRYQQGIPLTDRLDYVAPLSNNLAYVLAIEKALGVSVPERAQTIRVLLTELTRIQSHLVWLGTHALDLGAMSVFLYCFREREQILDMYEAVSGQRMMSTYFRVGGLAAELPPGFEQQVQSFLATFPDRLAEYEALLTQNPLWRQRTVGIGTIKAADAIALGLSGPSLRASGVGYDVRKTHPYSGYESYQFDVPIGKAGDVYEPPDRPPGAAAAHPGADQHCRSQTDSPAEAPAQGVYGGIDPPLQVVRGGLQRPGGRGVPGHRGPEGRAGRLPRERRIPPALSGPLPGPVLRQPPGPGADGRGAARGRCRRRDWLAGHRAGGDRPLNGQSGCLAPADRRVPDPPGTDQSTDLLG